MSEKIEQISLSTIAEEPEPLQINDVGDAFNQTVQSYAKTDEETFVDSSHRTSKTSIPAMDSDSPSFKCLKVISQSDSVLVNQQLLYFPEPGDPGIDAAFNFQEPEEYEDNTGCHRYRKKCAELHVMPISTVLNSLNTEVLDLKYYGLTEKQMLTIWEMLKINTSIKELNLQDNWMSKKAVIAFERISAMSPAFPDCFITDLDLSFNNLGNEGIITMEEHLKENTSIRKLNLSHNELDELCAKSLQGILKENETIEELDLSWNCFNTRDGNKRLFTGLLVNQNIKSLNLSWNGLNSEDCVRPLVQYMVGTKVLEYLDLSNNILRGKSLDLIRVGLIRNSSLIELKLGKNIFDEEEALTFATAMLKKTEKPLKLLDMTDMRVPKRFIKLLNKIREIGRDVVHGRRCDYDIYGPNIVQVIFDRCKYLCKKRKKKTRKLDFGVFLLSIPLIMMSPNEFEALLIKKKIRGKLDDDLLKELMFQFSVKKGKDYLLDVKLMLKAYFSFNPEVPVQPLKKVARKKRGKSGKKGKKKKKRKDKSQGTVGKTGESKAEPAEIKLEATNTKWDFSKTAFKKYSFTDLVTVDLPEAPQPDKEFEDCLCPEREMIMMAQQASLQAEPPSKVDKMKSSSLTSRSSTESTKRKSFSDHPHLGTLKKKSSKNLIDLQQQSMNRQSGGKLPDSKSKSSKQSSMQAIVTASNEGNFSKSRI